MTDYANVANFEFNILNVCTMCCLLTEMCFSNDSAKFKNDLLNIARTTLSSKILTQYKDQFSNLAVDAVLRLKVVNRVI